MRGAWDAYWTWVGGNVGAMPLEALITAAVTLLLVRPWRRLWRKVAGEHPAARAAAAAEEHAAAARQILADLFRHATGEEHELAPGRQDP